MKNSVLKFIVVIVGLGLSFVSYEAFSKHKEYKQGVSLTSLEITEPCDSTQSPELSNKKRMTTLQNIKFLNNNDCARVDSKSNNPGALK